jgi:hypothetical protein
MTERNEGRVGLTVITSKWAPAAAVTVSFPAPDLNWYVMQKLILERPCGCSTLASYSEYTALIYAMFDDIRDRLIGTPDAQLKSKVASITCGFNNGEFVISYVCQSSITGIRKSLGILISRLSPQKQYPRYQKYIKLLGGIPKRDEFMHCAKRIASKLTVSAFVVAKINTNKEKELAMLSVIAGKIPDTGEISTGKKPSSEDAPRGVTEFPEIKTTNGDSFFILDFLDSINTSALGAGNSVVIFNKQWKGAKKEMVDRYVTMRFSKLKDKLLPVILYSASSRGLLNVAALKSVAKSNPKPADITRIIKSILT